MTMTAYEEKDTHEMVYTISVKLEEFERAKFTELDYDNFKRFAQGSISMHILGLSILARRIEEGETAEVLGKQLPKSWRERVGEALDEMERSPDGS